MTGYARYIAVECAISACINATLSIAFVLLLFHGQARVAAGALITDALPQSLMIALMATLVPTLLTRRRLHLGVLAGPAPTEVAGRIVVRAILAAILVAALSWLGQWLLLRDLVGTSAPFGAVLAGKAIYGALLGALVTWWALRRLMIR